jgi:hypothetical protein
MPSTFLSPDYLRAKVTEIERKAGAPVLHPEETVRQVAKTAKFTDEMTDTILAHFIRVGQLTAGGVMQAVTSVAQTLDDAPTPPTTWKPGTAGHGTCRPRLMHRPGQALASPGPARAPDQS